VLTNTQNHAVAASKTLCKHHIRNTRSLQSSAQKLWLKALLLVTIAPQSPANCVQLLIRPIDGYRPASRNNTRRLTPLTKSVEYANIVLHSLVGVLMVSHRFVAFAACAAIGIFSGVGSAGAAFFKTQVAGAPAPLIGLGLPAAGLVLGAIWLVRRYRKN
jgi:hypothetical protein